MLYINKNITSKIKWMLLWYYLICTSNVKVKNETALKAKLTMNTIHMKTFKIIHLRLTILHLLYNHPALHHRILIFLSLSCAGHPSWEVQQILQLKPSIQTFQVVFQILGLVKRSVCHALWGSVCRITLSIPWSWESWRRIKGAEVARLGGTVAMEGTWEVEAEMTADAGMWAMSWSMLGLVGSSVKKENNYCNPKNFTVDCCYLKGQ